jgi:predicted transcriptional regulator
VATVLDIAIPPPLLLKPSMRIGEVLPKMKELKIYNAPVIDENGVLIGILSYRTVLSSGAGRDTKVRTVMEPPYSLHQKTRFEEAIAKIVGWKAREVPIVDDLGVVVGFITRNLILDYMLKNGLIPDTKVDDVMSKPPITIGERESIARARWLMLKHGITRLVVVDESNRVIGVITLSDIIERLYRIKFVRRKGFEWVESEESFLAAPVGDYMSAPPITIPTGSTLEQATKTLLDKGISGAPVTDSEERPLGVVSGLDILKAYVERLKLVYPIPAKISETIGDETQRALVEKLVNSYLSKFARYINVIDFKLVVNEESKVEKKEGRKRYNVTVKIVTDMGTTTTETTCWDLLTCVREALELAEKRLRKEIEKSFMIKRGGVKGEQS